ncbi:cytochrome P450 [Ceratobasidium sp. AG-I]|nr:cytochrome P450 [Ceratobasidium sp. AG-I]
MFSEYMLSSVLLLLASIFYSRKRKSRLPLPPSPKSDPIIGHFRVLPASSEHRAYRDLGVELKSDVISLTVLGQVIVVINSAEAAADIMVKRSAIYSDRPELHMLNDNKLLDWGKSTGFLPYGDRWKNQRAMTQSALRYSASSDPGSIMVKQSRLSLQRILKTPGNFEEEIRRMAAATILSSVYGYEPTFADDNIITVMEKAMSRLSVAALPGNFYVNIIPWLKYVPTWLPGTTWKRNVHAWRAEKEEMLNRPYEWTKAQMAGHYIQLLIWLCVDVLLGCGNCSTVHCQELGMATFRAFLIAMILHPEIQARAQAEIDSVLGGNRLPEMSDRNELPYLDCILKEVMRWRPIGPLGVPHACAKDDEYEGYLIPKGAIIIGNVWAMCNDPTTYPNPEKFDPDRFMDPSVPDSPAFGFVCPGADFARAFQFIAMSTFLTIFNIKPVSDEKGHDILPTAEMGPNVLISHPLPFECSITPRSDKHAALLNEWVEA